MRKLRVVVCGTTFGQVYIEALRAGPADLELAGILARGSERSRRCAERCGVPLFTRADELPRDVDVACVVIRSGLLGGRGAELAQELMARGIHVLQEHPLHHDELAACLRQARRHGVEYRLNSFYPHVEPVRGFIAAARALLARQRPLYVDAACGFQLAYSLLDILGRALRGVRPWAFAVRPDPGDLYERAGVCDVPFRTIEGVLAGVPFTLRVQNQMDPADPDNHAHLDHRIAVGTEGGNLVLVNTHGPLVCSMRPHYPQDPRDPASAPHFARAAGAGVSSTFVLGPQAAPDFLEIFRTTWPAAVRTALGELRQAIATGEDPLRAGQYHLSLCRLWQDLTERLGPPELLRRELPTALSAADVDAIRAAWGGARAGA